MHKGEGLIPDGNKRVSAGRKVISINEKDHPESFEVIDAEIKKAEKELPVIQEDVVENDNVRQEMVDDAWDDWHSSAPKSPRRDVASRPHSAVTSPVKAPLRSHRIETASRPHSNVTSPVKKTQLNVPSQEIVNLLRSSPHSNVTSPVRKKSKTIKNVSNGISYKSTRWEDNDEVVSESEMDLCWDVSFYFYHFEFNFVTCRKLSMLIFHHRLHRNYQEAHEKYILV